MTRSFLALTLLAAPLLAPACTTNAPLALEARIEPTAVPMFHGGGLKHGVMLELTDEEWAEIVAMFDPPAEESFDERVSIAHAVARMEQIAGERTGTSIDKGMNEKNPGWEGHLDCVDESTNTTIYLMLFQQQGLLKHHVVLERLRRTYWTSAMHWTAQVRDETTGVRYVIDSWFRNNGELPHVMRARDWENRVKPYDEAE